ncbi:MAG: sensor histidine kinase [Bacteroidota bacterium]
MRLLQKSLRLRIFISMIVLVLGASILIAGVTIYQYQEEANALHLEKLDRKEKAIRANINYVLRTTTYPVDTKNLSLIFKNRIFEIQEIHNEELQIYDLEGKLLKSSYANFSRDTVENAISESILNKLKNSPEHKHTENFKLDGQRYQSSYTYISDGYFKPIGILNLPYIEDDGYMDRELREFLTLLSQVYIIMLIAAIILAFFLSKFITKSLKKISDSITKTSLTKDNTKISSKNTSTEIKPIIEAYNNMIDELEQSAQKLAQSEREEAWRQMARQVAHEVKNPLTPMRLSVQSFERRFDPNDKQITEKVKEFSKTLIQQIDTMSSIAEAFSSFAKMPAQKDEIINLVETTRLALDIFNEDYIQFHTSEESIYIKLDKTQLIRVVTNLVKNALQATNEKDQARILVEIKSEEKEVSLSVSDNGRGISEENQAKIFEPKFTTKSGGMGLGLGMVKNIVEAYKGKISLKSKVGLGSTFIIKFPKK